MELTQTNFLRGCCYLTATTLTSSVIPLTRIFQLRLRLLFILFLKSMSWSKKLSCGPLKLTNMSSLYELAIWMRRLFALTTMHCLRKACHVWNRKMTTCTPMCLVVFLAESIAPEVPKLIKKTRCHRDYRMSLYGWMDYRIAAYDCTSKRIYTNWAGRPLKQTLLSVTKKRRKHK